jgi:hypothetical protein
VTGARAVSVVVALAIGLGLVACSVAPSPTTSPAASRPPSPAVSGSVASVSPAAPPPAGLAGWQRLPPQNGLAGGMVQSVVSAGDRFLGLGCLAEAEGCELPAIWESADGLEWQSAGPVFLPPNATRGTVLAASFSQFGFVAAGYVGQGDRVQASVWLRDPGGWAQAAPQSASDAAISALLVTDGGVLAVGSDAFMHRNGFRSWSSIDGRTWPAAAKFANNAEGYPTHLLPVDGAFLAWGPGCADVCGPVASAWWLSVDGTAWQPADRPRGLEDVWVTALDRTDGGFSAFGFTAIADAPIRVEAWTADNKAAEWRSVEPPPAGENSRLLHHLVVGGGSVAAGTGQLGPDPNQSGGLVWLRGPGESAWRAPMVIPDLEILALAQSPVQPNRVVVMGQTSDGDQTRVVIWTGLVDWAA